MRRTIASTIVALVAVAGMSTASHAVADHGHGRPDIPVWVVKPCATAHSVNCRVEGRHPHSIREVPGSARMVCVFYAQTAYAASHDYCEGGTR